MSALILSVDSCMTMEMDACVNIHTTYITQQPGYDEGQNQDYEHQQITVHYQTIPALLVMASIYK